MTEILDNGQQGFKLSVHLGLFGFAVACGLYNLGALMGRPHQRLALNVGIYGALAAWEVAQMQQHWQALQTPQS